MGVVPGNRRALVANNISCYRFGYAGVFQQRFSIE